MLIRVSKAKLEEALERRGFSSYQEAGEAAKRLGIPIAWRTIYTMVDGGNWRKESLEALCKLLGCTPAEIIEGWESEAAHTHDAPQPAEVLQAAG